MDPFGSIASLVIECSEKFRRILQAIEHPADQAQSGKIYTSVVDSRGRFKIWCGNLGAHKNDKSSLDHRLREARQKKQSVVELMKDLTSLLSNGRLPLSDRTL